MPEEAEITEDAPRRKSLAEMREELVAAGASATAAQLAETVVAILDLLSEDD